MKSVMTHSFSDAPSIEAPRSLFDRSHGYKTAFDAGKLIPFYWDEVLPGDSFKLNASILARMNTALFPIMDNMFLDTHFFFVPYRLIWDNSRKFFGEQIQPGDSIDYNVPIHKADATTGFNEGTIADYLGCPIGVTNIEVSALPIRSYYKIYDEWFRDQNLSNAVAHTTADTTLTSTGGTIKRRGKRHDYYTSCLPWPQKGTAVSLPLGTRADLTHDASAAGSTLTVKAPNIGSGDYVMEADGVSNYIESQSVAGAESLYADLTNATAATINDLREAFQVQKLLERDARGGTRYSEIIKNHFGVDFYDVSYRPEFLGGGSTPVNITQVSQTSNDGTNGAVGDLAAFGVASGNNHGFTKSFVEHGIVMGIVSVRADLTYQQGVTRDFLRSTRYDFYWPSLAHLGEQAVTNIEIYAQDTAADDNVFGYQERYAEYRYKPSKITSTLRSTAATPLDSWHLSQEFTSLPTLGNTFIEENPPVDRCIATPAEPHFIMDSYINLKCARPMPVFGVPGLIDHF
jgi:hypothetical protein